MSISLAYLNGHAATAAELAPLAFAGYAHFTAMQVRDRSVRGVDLHLGRLRAASDALFGHHLPDLQIHEFLRSALQTAPADSSLACFICSRPGEFMPAGITNDLDVLIKVTGPADPPAGPLALDVVRHERHLATVKHVGEVSKTLHLRQANARGFDDAVFEDRLGRLSEGTIWNLAFWDGTSIIWPKADLLPGVTMQILGRRLRDQGIPQVVREVRQSDLGDQISAVFMNSWSPAVPLSRIGGIQLADDEGLARMLRNVYATEPSTRF